MWAEYRSDQLAEPGDLSALPLQPDDDTWRRQALLIITVRIRVGKRSLANSYCTYIYIVLLRFQFDDAGYSEKKK